MIYYLYVSFAQYTNKSTENTSAELNTSSSLGLSTQQASYILSKLGPNITQLNTNTWWKIMLRQFKSAFIYLLLAASLIAFLLDESLDGYMIIAFVLINVFLGFYQEYKSDQTVKLLNKFIVKKSKVIRDGKEEIIKSEDLVIGDLVVIETGDIAPADLRLVKTSNLSVDESSLTGESNFIIKTEQTLEKETKQHYEAVNIVFAGTTVIEGQAYGIVIATGKNTEFGKITKLTTDTKTTSSFEKQIAKFSRFILVLTVTTLLLVFFTHLFFKQTISIGDLTIYAIALAVGVIPEGMPLVTTFSLSLAAAKLAKKHVVVKRLTAIEDLGGVQILCTDKTGTITENVLTVSKIYGEKDKVLLYGFLGSSLVGKEKTTNNSFDLAIQTAAGNKLEETAKKYKKLQETPFDPHKRKNAVLLESANEKKLIIRGAAEAVLACVTNVNSKESEEIVDWAIHQGYEGKRVLAVAERSFNNTTYTLGNECSNFNLVGLISFEDPIKKTTISAVEKAKTHGIKIKVLTGDSAQVAGLVALNTGIADKPTDVITGEEFFKLNSQQQFETLETINVYARVSPEQKYKIIELLQQNYEVGYLGDGINDAPALKIAGVAIAVNTAADVSRNVADIVLLQNNLKVIIDGIEMGRKTFTNVTNYIKATLASNFGNFYAMSFATLIIDYLPMLPVQILLVNLLSDFPMISISLDNVDSVELKEPKGYGVKDILLAATLLGLVSTSFDFITFGIFKSGTAKELQTYWFIESILTELMLIYSIRSRLPFYKFKAKPAKPIIILTIVAAIITIALPYTVLGTKVFGFIHPQTDKMLILAAIVAGYVILTEVMKKVYYTYFRSPTYF